MHSEFYSPVIQELLQQSIVELEENLKLLNKYSYPYALQVERSKLNNAWAKSKLLIQKPKALFIPILLFSSINYMETLTRTLAQQHSKN
ncbi:MAG: hypothetical protein Q9M36_04125 [Sulfurovum sp.]|nr:hypothetical protein [Sulfurovum sp.]